MLRRHQPLALLLCVALALGCQAIGGTGGAGPHLKRVLDTRVLRVGLSGAQPPLNMRNKQGELIGLEVDLVDALAASMGLETQLVTMPFAALLPALEAGDVDLVISGMTITPERNARVAFAGPYLASGKALLAKQGTLERADVPDEIDLSDRTYVSLEASTSERFVEEWLPNAGLETAPDYDTAIQRVLDGKVDALVADYPICIFTVMARPDAGLEAFTMPFTVEPIGIALRPGDPLFVNLLDNYLQSLADTGTLSNLKARWFSPGSWIDELP